MERILFLGLEWPRNREGVGLVIIPIISEMKENTFFPEGVNVGALP